MRIGVDFGGTKIEAAALDDAGVVVARVRRANPGGYDLAMEAVRELVAEVEGLVGPASVGIGMPGSVSPRSGTIRGANSVWLNGRPFREDLEAALGRAAGLVAAGTGALATGVLGTLEALAQVR